MTLDKDKPFKEMTSEEMSNVMRKVKSGPAKKKGKHPYSVPGVRLHGYLPAKMREDFTKCSDFAWRSGYLKRKNEYHFVSWAVERIMDAIKQEMAQNPRYSDLQDSQE